MLEKQKQEVGNNSTAIQVQGDYHGSSYAEIKEIFLDLFQLNFPKVQEIAAQKAQERIDSMLEQLKQSFEKHKNDVDSSKFTEPAIQYEMQAMAIDVARRGDKSNIELLCELLSTVLSKDCPELIELISGEARRVLPMLSKRHIAYLSLEVLANEASVTNITVEKLNITVGEMLQHISEANDITLGDLQYIACTGAIETRGIIHVGVVPSIVKSVEDLKDKKLDELKSLCDERGFSNIKQLLAITEKFGVGKFQLMAVGRLIGWLNLSKYSNVDVKSLF